MELRRALTCAALLIGLSAAHVSTAARHTSAEKDNVISKVIEMLESNKDKVSEDLKHDSQVMAEYLEWCDDEQSETGYAIKTSGRKIDDLNAEIQDQSAQIKSLDEEIAKLGSEMAERQEEIDEANKLREKQKKDFEERQAEQTAMVEELEQMEIELKKQMAAMTTPPPIVEEGEAAAAEQDAAAAAAPGQVPPAPVFLQAKHGLKIDPVKHTSMDMSRLRRAMTEMVDAVWVDPASQKALGVVHGLLQEDGLMKQMEDPEATPPPTVEISAEQHGQMQQNSDDNLAAFEMLKGKAQESLEKMRTAEQLEQHNHDLRIQSLLDAIHLCEDKTDDAKRDHSRLSEERGNANNELATTKETKASDEQALAGLKTECEEGAKNWDSRQKEAKAEMAAISKAKEILASRVTVLVQSPSDVEEVNARVQKTRNILVDHFRMLGTQLHSLAMLNLVSVSSSQPMAQVKSLLGDLIAKLNKEAAAAESLHEFCKAEKTKTQESKEEKMGTIEKLENRLDKASSKKEALAEAVAELSSEIASADKASAEAQKIRTDEKAVFTQSEADYKEAADAVSDAIDALKDYYGNTFLLQREAAQSKRAPPALGGAKNDAAGGIVGIMETMQAEFRKTVTKMQSEEREAEKQHEMFVHDTKVSTAAKKTEIKGAESEMKSLSVAINNFNQDHKLASKELDSVMEYIEKLKPQCEGRTVPFAERQAKREAEINGLKEALSIIDQDAGFIQVQQHLRLSAA